MSKKKEDLLSSLIDTEGSSVNIPENLTILPLRDIVIYPYMIFPVLIGRTSTLKAVAEAVERDKFMFLSTQINSQVEDPGFDDIYKYGTIAKIIQVLRLPNNLLKVLVEGVFHGRVNRRVKNSNFLEANIKQVPMNYNPKDKELEAMIRQTTGLFKDYIQVNDNLPPDIIGAFENIDDPIRKIYYAAANLQAKVEVKQSILQERSLKKQYFVLSSILSNELELLKIEDEIDIKVQGQIQKTQKKFYIQEQIRALQKELGEDEELDPELAEIRKAIDNSKMPDYALKKANEEFEKLKKTPQMSPDYGVNRNFLDTMTKLPWNNFTPDNMEISHVKNILDEDHYDLVKPKDRVLEFISVLNLAGRLKRQIICFVGPPGVGKTSLAKSIARALGRKFVRISLGGIRDEAEIRGHRRTYVGALPGKILQSMKKAGSTNPVLLLDEIDKMSMDFRGDPSSALLEVLDPEQNVNFTDHYLETEFDLSNVMFIATANVGYQIPAPLLDRMEVIELTSYLDPEKKEIAKRHIIPKLLKEYGLNEFDIKFKDKALIKLISEYTREAGVRNLERSISSIFRKLARDIVYDYDLNRKSKVNRKKALKENPNFKKYIKNKNFLIDEDKIEKYLKSPKYKTRKEDLADKIGVATGLAWTSVGGDTLPVEVTIMPGVEKLTLTGQLGDVMKESAIAALSYVRSNYSKLNIDKNFNKKKEIHIHVPDGAIPKDGPSAGITMSLALISAASGIALRGDLAMTGEVNLRGKVTAIGGLKEKLLAAKKIGVKTVLCPYDNKSDVKDIDSEIKKGLDIILIKEISEALSIAFRDWNKKNS